MVEAHLARAAALSANDLAALKDDLARLNAAAPGAGDRAVRYVASGTDTSVLLEIKALGSAALAPFGEHGPNYEDHRRRRRRALVDTEAWRPAVVHRFAVLLDVLWEASGRGKTDDNSPRWLTVLMLEVSRITYGTTTEPGVKPFYAIACLEELLAAAGAPKAGLLHYLYEPVYYASRILSHHMDGLADFLVANAGMVADTLPKFHADGRERLLYDLGRLNLAGAPFFDLVFASAIGSSKNVRKAARAVLRDAPHEHLLAKAEAALSSGSTDQRRETVDVLVMLVGAAARDLLTAQLERDKSKPVRDAIAAALARLDAALPTEDGEAMRAIDGCPIDVPPMPALPEDTPLPGEALEPVRRLIAPFNAEVARRNMEREALYKARGWNWFNPEPGVDEGVAVDRFLALVNGQDNIEQNPLQPMLRGETAEAPALKQLFQRPDFTLWHLLRLVKTELTHWRNLLDVVDRNPDLPARVLRARLAEGLDLRLVVEMLARLGTPSDQIARGVLSHHYRTPYAELDCPTMHLYFLNHIELIEEALGMRAKSGELALQEKAALQVLASLPQVPERLLRPLLDLALGQGKQARAPTRALLASAAGIDEAIIARLADAKKDIRATAAEWIGERGIKPAIAALKATLKKEKAEEARAALLTALARLGEDISEHFSQKALKAEADKGLAKTPAKSIEWFPFAALPALKWNDGKVVDPTIVKWWIVLADKLKNPAGNALFELYLDRLKTEDRERFGRFLLQAFIERDTTSCSEEEALATAKQRADQEQHWWQGWHQRNPEQASQHRFNYDQAFAAAKAAKLREHIHSCSENKGLLGLTMRAPGRDAAALVHRYLKDHGNKVNQSKALLTALAQNPSPVAIQVVLAAANRLKQKTVQALAKELIEDIAERRGWTADELADRTIPSAGFDEAGEMELDCGQDRLFRALYRGDGKIDLINPDGKVVKGLPQARGDADKEPVAAAKKALADARKEIKQVESLQLQRLYEAMCVERTWLPETWVACLQRHPIAGRLCQRLVWIALDGEGRIKAGFRPLEDGSLSNTADATVELADAAAIKVAHQALLPPADAQSWLQHLADYEVEPLFAQFGKSTLSLDGEAKAATAIEDRKGWMIDSFKLQSAVAKLGYERGEVYDGGGFSEYVKRFDGVGLRAVVEFSGSYVGANESFPCALVGLSFQRTAGQGRRVGKALRLAEVPPVLMSEAWGDLYAIAAAGSGYDPDWEKKRYF